MFFRNCFNNIDDIYFQFDQIFLELQKFINDSLLEARLANKKILLIAGEQHTQLVSLIYQMILLIAANHGQINNLIVEYAEEFVMTILSRPRENKKLNTEHSIPFAKYTLRMNIIPADLGVEYHSLPADQKDIMREKRMVGTCGQMRDHALFIVGSNHVKPLAETMRSQFYVKVINISASSLFENAKFGCMRFLNYIDPSILNYGPPDLGERYDFANNPNEVKQIRSLLKLSSELNQRNIIPLINEWYLQKRLLGSDPNNLSMKNSGA